VTKKAASIDLHSEDGGVILDKWMLVVTTGLVGWEAALDSWAPEPRAGLPEREQQVRERFASPLSCGVDGINNDNPESVMMA